MDENEGRPPPQEWIDALARADADVAAGRVVDGAAILERMRATAERLEARKRRRRAHLLIHRRKIREDQKDGRRARP